MKKVKKIGFISLYMAVSLSTAACTGKVSSIPEESIISESIPSESSAATSVTNAEKVQLLSDMTKAIELQYPDQTFTDDKEVEAAISPLLFGGAYLYASRQSSDGIQYIAAVCTSEENPLEDMTCGNGEGLPGFTVNQFDNGRILLMEKNGASDSGLSYIYNALQRGTEGIRYLTEVGERGVSLIPPADSAFLKISMVKEGIAVTEFVPLSEEERERLLNGTPVSEDAEWSNSIVLCDSKDELSAVWNGGSKPVTEEMVSVAAENCDFNTPHLTDIENIVKAQLVTTFYGEKRTESLENWEELELLTTLLSKAEYTGTRYDRDYGGQLLLTKQDGETQMVQLALEDGGFILGNAVFCELSGEETKAIWSLFSKTEGFRRFGNRISMQMETPSVTAEDAELRFILSNHTGGTIHYSLSPILYKKSEDSSDETWKRIDTIGGFCGTNSETIAEETSLTIPWKGIFELEGAGTYKIEIQVMPEPDLRFAISAEFKLN